MPTCIWNFVGGIASRTLTNAEAAFNTPGGAIGNGAINYVAATNDYFLRTITAAAGPEYRLLAQFRNLEAAGIAGVAGDQNTGAYINLAIGTAVGVAATAGIIGGITVGLPAVVAGGALALFVGAAAQAAYDQVHDGGAPTFDCHDPNDPNNPDNPNYDPNHPYDPNDPNPFDPHHPYDPTKPYGPNNPYDPNGPPDPNNPWDPRNPRDPNNPNDPRNHRPPWDPTHNPLKPPKRDPLVLDLNGDGVRLIAVRDSHAQFDLDGDGFKERTGWVSPEDGFLVRDSNLNGLVDGVGELFGNAGEDGFTALARIDSNADGVIDSLDTAYADLRVWRDANGDGISQSGELESLSQAGVAAISLASASSGQSVSDNTIGRTGSFVRSDGSQGTTASAYFAVDTIITTFTPPAGYQESEFASIAPRLKGYGTVADFSYALSTNAALAQAATTFLTETASLTGAQLRESFEHLIAQWAGVSSTPTDRGLYINATHLAVVEAFFGTTFEQQIGGRIDHNPDANNAPAIEKAYQAIIDSYLTEFTSQAAVGRYLYTGGTSLLSQDADLFLSALQYDPLAGRVTGDASLVIKAAALLAPADAQDGYKYFDRLTTELAGTKLILFSGNASGLTSTWDAALQGLTDRAAASALLERTVADTWIKGSQGHDEIYSGTNADVLVGGGGDDYLEGGAGSDMYRYTSGDGNDHIADQGAASDVDVLKLTNLNAADVQLRRSGNDLWVRDLTTGQEVKIDRQFQDDGTWGINQLAFADGTSLDREQIRLGAVFYGGDGNDEIYGSALNDTLEGLKGNDYLEGREGSDIYRYASGDGNDRIVDNGSATDVDVLKFTDLNADDVQLHRWDNELYVRDLATGQEIRVDRQFQDDGAWGLNQIVFADGTSLDREAIRQAAWFQGGDNYDEIYGSALDDTLVGNKGNDYLEGRGGGDTYRYTSGDGNDHIADQGAASDVDVLKLTNLNAADVQLRRSGNDLWVRDLTTGQEVKIDRQFQDDGTWGINQLAFADGTSLDREQIRLGAVFYGGDGNDEIYGSALNDTLEGLKGNDYLEGREGSDIYRYASGDGNDRIVDNGSATDVDVLKFTDLNADDVQLHRWDNELYVRDLATGQEIRVDRQFQDDGAWGLNQIVFADGTSLDREAIRQAAWFQGGDNYDEIYGSALDDTLVGNKGNDYLEGRGGGDTYRYSSGDGNDHIVDQGAASDIDTLKLTDLNAPNVQLRRSGNDLWVRDLTTGQEVKVDRQFQDDGTWGLNQIVFADGTSLNREVIRLGAVFYGGDGNDEIYGSAINDTLEGGKGNDYLEGREGSDTYRYASGDGNDRIADSGNAADTNVLKLIDLNPADVQLRRSGNDLLVRDIATGQVTKVDRQFQDDGTWGIGQLSFADGTTWDRLRLQTEVWIRGDAGDNEILGTNDSETLVAGLGNDTLYGYYGNDTYLYAAGDGNDVINDTGDRYDFDVLQLTDLNPDQIELRREGNDLFFKTLATAQEAKVLDQFAYDARLGIEQIAFADGTTWDRNRIQQEAWIRGDASNGDVLGSDSSETLVAGSGNHILRGYYGNDMYRYTSGNGSDVIEDRGDRYDFDVVQFTDLNQNQVQLRRDGNDLYFKDLVTSRETKVSDQFAYDARFGIEQILFADGTAWDRNRIQQEAWIRGDASGSNLAGSDLSETLVGGLGNDVISGFYGNDTYRYASGDGNDKIIDVGDRYESDVLQLTDLNAEQVQFRREGSDLFFKDLTTNQESEVQDQFAYDARYGLEQIVFADGSTWDRNRIQQEAWVRGDATGGNVNGSDLSETLVGGLGNDVLSGYYGNDTYRYASGDGDDVIDDRGDRYEFDVLQLTDLGSDDIAVRREGNDLFVQDLTTGSEIKVLDQFAYDARYGIEQILFADGTTWDRNAIEASMNGGQRSQMASYQSASSVEKGYMLENSALGNFAGVASGDAIDGASSAHELLSSDCINGGVSFAEIMRSASALSDSVASFGAEVAGDFNLKRDSELDSSRLWSSSLVSSSSTQSLAM